MRGLIRGGLVARFLARSVCGFVLISSVGLAQAGAYEVKTVVDGLETPWSMAWLPDGHMLITERRGELLRFDPEDESLTEIEGVPEVRAEGQGGLFDVVVHPRYKQTGWLYLAYAYLDAESGRSSTAIVRARLEEGSLVDQEPLYRAEQDYGLVSDLKSSVKQMLGKPAASDSRAHYGGRIAFDGAGYLYFSIGDRGSRDLFPQDLTRDGGKIYRIHDDGRIPEDNPFVTSGDAKPAIYTYGHRNPQGMAVHPATGRIWIHEHGPKGGDEINVIEPGANYGWPILSHGVNYSGTEFAEGTEREGFRSPAWHWTPSIAPSGMAFVTSQRYPEWKGGLLVGSLKFGYLVLCRLEGDRVTGQEIVLEDLGRVRDVREGPDGFIYVALEGRGIVRVVDSSTDAAVQSAVSEIEGGAGS
jgi:glucose/arabinose dehydrogenase